MAFQPWVASEMPNLANVTKRMDPDGSIAKIAELLQEFKLIEWKHEKVKTFSKGMRQKLGIIQSILIDPQIIILDEPQSGLDPKAHCSNTEAAATPERTAGVITG